MLKKVRAAIKFMANADGYLAQQEHISEFVQLLESHCEQARGKIQDLDSLLASASGAQYSSLTSRPRSHKLLSAGNLEYYGVSFVMPVYNAAGTLRAAISSVQRLSLDYQLIIVDDCSTDESHDIASTIARWDDRILVVRQPFNVGPGPCRNVGLQYASKEYTMFADADDLVQADGVEHLYSSMIANEDICIGRGNLILAPGGQFPREVNIVEQDAVLDTTTYNAIPWFFQSFIFNTAYLLSNGVSFPPLRLGEDPVFLTRALLDNDKLLVVSEVVYLYNQDLGRGDEGTMAAAGVLSLLQSLTWIRKTCLERNGMNFYINYLNHELPVIDYTVSHRLHCRKSELAPLQGLLADMADDRTLQALNSQSREILRKMADERQLSHRVCRILDDRDFYDISSLRKPTISVLIALYNQEEYIARCLNSVLAQTQAGIEIIVVDDGSTDGSGEVARRYAAQHEHVRCIEHTENEGLLAARLTGIRHASGHFLAFLDSDDWIERDTYAKLYENARREQVSVARCRRRCVQQDGRVLHPQPEGEAPKGRIRSLDYLALVLRDRIWDPSICTMLLDTTLVTGATRGMESNDIVTGEDWCLLFAIFSQYDGDVHVDESYGVNYYIHSESNTHSIELQSAKKNIHSLFSTLCLHVYPLARRHGGFNIKSFTLRCRGIIWSSIVSRYIEGLDRDEQAEFAVFLYTDALPSLHRHGEEVRNAVFDSIDWSLMPDYAGGGSAHPKISVVVPVYNVENYLSSCLDSILGQSFADLEVIIVDDGSTDGSLETAEQYAAANSCIELVRHGANKGLPAARNSGIIRSRGEYVILVDADDVLATRHALLQLYLASVINASVVTFGGAELVDDSGRRDLDYHRQYKFARTVCSDFERSYRFMMKVSSWNILVEKALLSANGLCFDEDIRIYEDNYFTTVLIMLADRITVVNCVTYDHIQRRGSIMQQQALCKYKSSMDKIFAHKRTIEHVKENDAIADERKLVFYRYIVNRYAVSFEQNCEPWSEGFKAWSAWYREVYLSVPEPHRRSRVLTPELLERLQATRATGPPMLLQQSAAAPLSDSSGQAGIAVSGAGNGRSVL